MSMGRLAATCDLKGLSAIQFRVLACLANHENDITGKCNPSYATIAKETEISGRYAKMVIDSLCELKLITVEETFAKSKCHSSNTYHFSFQKISQDKVCGEQQFTTSSKGSESQFTTVVKDSSPPLCTTDHHVVNHSSPKPVIESGVKPRKPNQEGPTAPTPPSGSGGGGVVGKPMAVRPWPTRSEFQAWLNEVCVKLGGLLPDDGYRNLLATFDQMTDRGRIDANGRRVQNWQLFFGKIARKEAEKWRVPELIVA